jgi:hypothetical protein
MKNYLTIFKDSSFRLKPTSLRFSETEEPVKDLLRIYKDVMIKNDNILNDFFYKYNNILVAFESYKLPKTFLMQIESNLKFNIGSSKTTDKFGNSTYNIGINQCFIPRKSKISTANNVSMYFESAAIPGLYITLNGGSSGSGTSGSTSGNGFIMQALSQKTKSLMNQAFYIEKSKTTDNEEENNNNNNNEMISIRTANNDSPMYLAFENNQTKAYLDTVNQQANNNMSFILNVIPFNFVLKIITLFEGSLKTMGGNIIGVLENNISDGTPYYIIPMKESSSSSNAGGSNFNIYNGEQFMLQNKDKKTYVVYDPITSFVYDREMKPNLNCIFSIGNVNGYFTILNTNSDNLVLYNNNLLKFIKEKDVQTNENMFQLDISYELK